jgi:hypothetical protein
MHTHNTVETGMVLPGFGKLKPVPVPVHTGSTLSRVYPYLCHALSFNRFEIYEHILGQLESHECDLGKESHSVSSWQVIHHGIQLCISMVVCGPAWSLEL